MGVRAGVDMRVSMNVERRRCEGEFSDPDHADGIRGRARPGLITLPYPASFTIDAPRGGESFDFGGDVAAG